MSDAEATTPERRKFLIERVIQVAERRAEKAVTQTQDTASDGIYQADDSHLVALATRELDRQAARAQILSDSQVSDRGWRILLNLFVSEQCTASLPELGVANQWNGGEETELRHIAGLMSLGLIQRATSSELGASLALALTAHGREMLRKALRFDD